VPRHAFFVESSSTNRGQSVGSHHIGEWWGSKPLLVVQYIHVTELVIPGQVYFVCAGESGDKEGGHVTASPEADNRIGWTSFFTCE
jgi:hypothetical protein